MRAWHAVAVAATVGLAGAVTQAAGQSTPSVGSPTAASITVNGSASQTLSSQSSDADRQAAYNAALADALDAAQAKAAFVAGHEDVTLGALENVTELSDTYPGYCGDVFTPVAARSVSNVSTKPVTATKKHAKTKKKSAKPVAKKAQIVAGNSCPVQAQVTVTYLIAAPVSVSPTTTTTTTTTTSTTTTSST
jgi:hypothetical protein